MLGETASSAIWSSPAISNLSVHVADVAHDLGTCFKMFAATCTAKVSRCSVNREFLCLLLTLAELSKGQSSAL